MAEKDPVARGGEIVLNGGGKLARPSGAPARRALENRRLLARNRIRVLVADDERNITELIEDMLSRNSYDVRTTCEPWEVVELARNFKPHVAMLGVVMPHAGGVELSLELFKILPRTKFVLMTERVDEAIFQDLRGKGLACDALPAPFPPDDLLALMARLTGESE